VRVVLYDDKAAHESPAETVALEFWRRIAHGRAMANREPESGHEDPLEQMFRRSRLPLLAWFRVRVGDPAEAEDLVQECFLRIRQRGEVEMVAQFDAYLYRTAKSVLADRRRRRAVRHADAHVPLHPDHGGPDDGDALRSLLAKERLHQVSAVLMTMPERTRSIFILCRLEGLRYAEIAARFGISVSAVQKHMLRAIEALLSAGEKSE
jgi:RNA polymerase sigma-70 factor (ECF subfamily)